MALRQTIAVIGASGQYGAAIAKALSAGAYRLLLMDPNENGIAALQKAIDCEVPQADVEQVACCREACWEADLILFALPFSERNHLIAQMQEVVTRKTVVFLLDQPEKNALNILKKQLPYSGIITIAMYLPVSAADAVRIGVSDSEAGDTATKLLHNIRFNEIIQSVKTIEK
ncbi:MAG: NAD(P)-binding domain-containing protein [Sediminibacterium sp.]|nr:NAD(P)-binding domain-containing protein [Sediminibacterium sp.]